MTRLRDVTHAIASLPDAREDGRTEVLAAVLDEIGVDSKLSSRSYRLSEGAAIFAGSGLTEYTKARVPWDAWISRIDWRWQHRRRR